MIAIVLRAAPMLAISREGLGSVDHEDEHFLSEFMRKRKVANLGHVLYQLLYVINRIQPRESKDEAELMPLTTNSPLNAATQETRVGNQVCLGSFCARQSWGMITAIQIISGPLNCWVKIFE